MGDLIGGESPLPPSRLRSRLLRRLGRVAAAYCVTKCYETWPELGPRYGLRGRQHLTRDAAWHLEHLDEAVDLGEPRLFDDYADWLTALLQARGIGPEQVAGAFGFLADAFEAAECPPKLEAERAVVVAILRDNQLRLTAPAATLRRKLAIPSMKPKVKVSGTIKPGSDLQRDYFDCLRDQGRKGAFALAESYVAGGGAILDFYVDVLEPVLENTGSLWEGAQISSTQEHEISEVTSEVIHRYGPTAWIDAPPSAPVAVVCCVPRERHRLGLMMVADALRAGELDVLIPDESLTAQEIVDLVNRVDARMLCLSCTLALHLSDASELIALARRSRPSLAIAIGGRALRDLGPGAAERLGADWTADNAREVRRSVSLWSQSLKT